LEKSPVDFNAVVPTPAAAEWSVKFHIGHGEVYPSSKLMPAATEDLAQGIVTSGG